MRTAILATDGSGQSVKYRALQSSSFWKCALRALLICAPVWIILAHATASAQNTDEVVYYHTDAIGSVRMITDATGAVIDRYDYLPFGERWAPPAQPAPDMRQFAGKERDAERASTTSAPAITRAVGALHHR